jgi:hypothetical protein
MKFTVTMKTPDVLRDSIIEAINNLPDSEQPYEETILKKCEQWFEYEECLTVEIDTEKNTCIVLKA